MEQRGGTQPGKKQIMQKRLVFVKRSKQGQEKQEKPEEMLFRYFSGEGEGICTEACRKAEAGTSSVCHVVQAPRDCKHFDEQGAK